MNKGVTQMEQLVTTRIEVDVVKRASGKTEGNSKQYNIDNLSGPLTLSEII